MRSPLGALTGALAGALVNRAPVPLVADRKRGSLTSMLSRRNTVQTMDALMDTFTSVGTVFAIADRLSSSTAMVEWKLWKKAASGIAEDRTEVTSHGVLDLLENPNPFMSRMELMEAGQQHFELVGEVDLAVGRLPGVKYPLELWPVMPQALQPVPDKYKLLKGWLYTGPNGEEVPLGVDELIRHRRPNPRDPYRGVGAVQSILTSLDAQRYSDQWQRNFYLNSAQPGGIIEVDRRLSDDEFDEMSMRWREQHQGLSKAHRIAIIEQGAKWVDAKITQRDMQFAELNQVSREVIREAFGFPKGMLGTVDDVNRANAEAGEYMFGKWLVEPRLRRWRSMFNKHLLPLFGQDVARNLELDFESPVPENSEQAIMEIDSKSAALVALTGAGFEPAEVLDFFNWPELKYTKPEPPQIVAPPGAPGQKPGSAGGKPPKRDDPTDEIGQGIDAAMRWEVEVHEDDSTCEPCLKQRGKVYRNRADAYADYPGGQGYRRCVGEQYGNSCRCTVVKRRKRT